MSKKDNIEEIRKRNAEWVKSKLEMTDDISKNSDGNLKKKKLNQLNPEIQSMFHSTGNGTWEFEGHEFKIDN